MSHLKNVKYISQNDIKSSPKLSKHVQGSANSGDRVGICAFFVFEDPP